MNNFFKVSLITISVLFISAGSFLIYNDFFKNNSNSEVNHGDSNRNRVNDLPGGSSATQIDKNYKPEVGITVSGPGGLSIAVPKELDGYGEQQYDIDYFTRTYEGDPALKDMKVVSSGVRGDEYFKNVGKSPNAVTLVMSLAEEKNLSNSYCMLPKSNKTENYEVVNVSNREINGMTYTVVNEESPLDEESGVKEDNSIRTIFIESEHGSCLSVRLSIYSNIDSPTYYSYKDENGNEIDFDQIFSNNTHALMVFRNMVDNITNTIKIN